MTISKKRKKKLDETNSKFKLKANKSTMNFKSKKRLKKLDNDSSEDSDEESESDDEDNKGRKSNKNKKGKKRNIKNYKNKNRININKRSQSVKTLKSKNKNKNKMLRTNRSETRKNKLFNRSIQSENTKLKSKNKNFSIKKRSQTPNTSRYNTFNNNNKQKYRGNIIGSAYSRRFEKFKRTSFDQINKKYRLITELDERNKKNYWFNSINKRRDSEDGFKSFNFRTSKYTQNSSNYFKIGSRKFEFLNNYQREREEGFYNRITLFPNIEENKLYDRKYLHGDGNNPYSVKWPSHFLEIGYNSGFYYEEYQDGVPILRLKKLKNKVVLPQINSKYSQVSERRIEVPTLNFTSLSRQDRLNYILNSEANNDENNVFKSLEARKKLLEKFNVKNKNKK